MAIPERWQARNAPNRWRPPEGWHRRAARARGGADGPEARLEHVRRGFREVFRPTDRAARLGRVWRRTRIPALAVVGGLAPILVAILAHPWPPTTTLRHLVAFHSCAVAWEMGLTPSRTGRPGYWRSLDYDGDGRSCEDWTERRRAAGLHPFDGAYGRGWPWRRRPGDEAAPAAW